jgi:hypothetical protein
MAAAKRSLRKAWGVNSNCLGPYVRHLKHFMSRNDVTDCTEKREGGLVQAVRNLLVQFTATPYVNTRDKNKLVELILCLVMDELTNYIFVGRFLSSW